MGYEGNILVQVQRGLGKEFTVGGEKHVKLKGKGIESF